MKHTTIPILTTAIGILLGITLILTGATAPRGEQALPLLMMLFMSEMGVIVSLGGALYGLKLWQKEKKTYLLLNTAAGIALAVAMLIVGLKLWSATGAA